MRLIYTTGAKKLQRFFVSTQGHVRWIRWIGLIVVLSMPVGCAICASKMVPNQARMHVSFCSQYFKAGQLDQAEARCKLALQYAPDYWAAFNGLGLIAYKRGYTDKAIGYFKKAIAANQHFVNAFNNLGAVYMDQGKYSMACNLFDQAVGLNPGFVAAHLNSAMCSYQLKQWAKASQQYKECLELDPNQCRCYLGLGLVAVQRKDNKEARKQFKRQIQACPTDPIGFYNLCWVDYMLQKCDDAVQACVEALSLKPGYMEARRNLVASYQCLSLQDGVVKQVMTQLKNNPSDPQAHYKLARLYMSNQNVNRALDEFNNVIKLSPKYMMAYYYAATLYNKQLNGAQTIKMCRKFLSLVDPEQHTSKRKWCVERLSALQYN